MQILYRTAPLFLVAGLAAQANYTVSPAAYTSTQGNSNNTIPFWSATHRYQQIHGDLKGTPRVMQGMSLRKSSINLSSAVARTIDVTMLMADSDYANRSSTFASNYAGTPVTVLPRTTVNLPDWTTSGGNPEPWTVVVPFKTVFVYTGLKDLVWEWQIHSTSATGTYPADAYGASNLYYQFATYVQLGTGCIATGKTSRMTQSMSMYSTLWNKKLNFYLYCSNAPNSVPAAFLVSPVNPNVNIPGVCTTLYSTGLWSFSVTTSSSGAVTMTPSTLVVDHDASWAGAKLYAQTVALDVGQAGVPVALSQGTEGTVPGFAAGGGTPISRIWVNSDTAATGNLSEGYPYGLVVRFTH